MPAARGPGASGASSWGCSVKTRAPASRSWRRRSSLWRREYAGPGTWRTLPRAAPVAIAVRAAGHLADGGEDLVGELRPVTVDLGYRAHPHDHLFVVDLLDAYV